MITLTLDLDQAVIIRDAINERIRDTEWAEVFGPRVEVERLREVADLLNDIIQLETA